MSVGQLPETVVIVGASVAGVTAARALRSEGHAGNIVLLGAEPDWPYDKPPLSKQVLAEGWDAERVSLLTPAQADELNLDVRLGARADRLDLARRQVDLEDGSSVPFGACVLATGCAARPSPWGVRPGLNVLRTWDDAAAIRDELRAGESIAVVGGGFIGSEIAASARSLGKRVTMIDPVRIPMERLVGEQPASLFLERAERYGVELILGHGVEAIDGTAGALQLRLTDGRTVEVDCAVVGIGAVPNDGWLASSGLAVENGVICDQFCRASEDGLVFAAGDVARWRHPTHDALVRVEHWTNAVDQAACVAYNLTHPDDPRAYAPIHYVWTDQYASKFQIVGRPASAASHVMVGDPSADGNRAAVVYADGHGDLVGALSINWPRAMTECRRGLTNHLNAGEVVKALTDRLGARA